MVIHACVFSQALFSTELHWRTNCTLRRSRRSTCLAACWPPLNCLWATLGSTLPWLATIPPLPCSARHLPVLTPCLDRCFTITSQILRRNLRTLFLVSFKTAGRRFFDHRPAFFRPPTGVFFFFFDHRPATDRLPTGYRRLPTGYRRLPTGYRRLPSATDRLSPATDRLPQATDRLPPATDRLPPVAGYHRLPTGYRRLPTCYRPATTGYRRLPTGYRRLPTGYRRLPPTTAGYRPATAGYLRLPPATNRLQTGYRRFKKKKKKKKKKREKKKKKKKKILFDAWGMPLVLSTNRVPDLATGRCRSCPKIFGTRATKWGLYVCLSIYIWTLNT